MNDVMSAKVAAYEQTVRSTIAVTRVFQDADWDRPTECPGWAVKDQLAHIAGVERSLLGDPLPVVELPDDLPHVRNEFGRLMEVMIHSRRSMSGPAVVAELTEALEHRLAALSGIDPERQVMCPDGNMGSYTRFMAFRALDCWVHEQDIRRAVGRPGNLDAPAGFCLWELFGNGLRTMLARAKAEPGQSAILTTSGPLMFRKVVLVDEDGRGQITSDLAGPPTVELRMGWDTYVRLVTGRCGPEVVQVAVEGDEDLAARILTNMALSP
jgi:uncharacterized protein (TIGR03083 family)